VRSLKSWPHSQLIIAASFTALSGCASVEGVASGAGAAGSSSNAARSLESIVGAVQKRIDDGSIPGALVHISEHGQSSYMGAQGYADLERRVPVAPDTIFRFYSMTKPITCAAVMTLYDAGRIDLDAPISRYLPEFRDMRVRTASGLVSAKRAITVRHLMTHTSGLAYEILPGPVSEDYRSADVFAIRNRTTETLEAHVKRLSKLPLALQPGEGWNYGESMGVLGRLVEVVSGQSYRTYLKANVLNPLGMTDTDFFVPAEKAHRLATLYTKADAAPLQNAQDTAQYGGSYLEQPKLEYGGAGLVGTAGDYMRFAHMLLAGGTHKGVRILSKKSVGMMMSNQLPLDFGEHPLVSAGRAPGVGFGFCGLVVVARDKRSPPGSVGEYGWSGWASTAFWVDPDRDLAGLVLTQVIPDEVGAIRLADDVREVIYRAAY
jgi:CubicO group peptidase (beta-lactamase class C family)